MKCVTKRRREKWSTHFGPFTLQTPYLLLRSILARPERANYIRNVRLLAPTPEDALFVSIFPSPISDHGRRAWQPVHPSAVQPIDTRSYTKCRTCTFLSQYICTYSELRYDILTLLICSLISMKHANVGSAAKNLTYARKPSSSSPSPHRRTGSQVYTKAGSM